MEMNTTRNNGFWNMVRISNEDKEYPSNMGQKWSDEEERLKNFRIINTIKYS